MGVVETMADGRPPNLLTFDIEGFIEASHDSMYVPAKYISAESERQEIEANTLEIVELLAEFGQRATFFILGRIARDMPGLIRRIAEAGHEIGCHSFEHRRLFHFPRPDVQRFLGEGKRYLEDAGGVPVVGFRAPDFSITNRNIWAFDVLKELGFLYDSSVMPTDLHDVYGIGGFPRQPFVMDNGLVELPMSTIKVWKHNVPFAGGGYLRLYPTALTRGLIRIANRRGEPAIVYLHPFEMGKIVPRIREIPLIRRFRTYTGVRTAATKLRSLLDTFRFVRAIDYVRDTHLLPVS
jgi:polysaccharide deacetylase family protein (PEP-CTERM system associated)